jgi:formamidopyrimidine-DNA glycosylase
MIAGCSRAPRSWWFPALHPVPVWSNQQTATSFLSMPELPEVEHAAAIARAIAAGRTITSVSVRHRAQRRGLPPRDARSLVGDRVMEVVRRGKAQRFHMASGRELRIHFRMTGDWLVPGSGTLPRSVRVVFDFDDGGRLALDDPRALSVVSLVPAPDDDDDLGPDALARSLNARYLAGALATRRIPIKVALLDQSLIAGIGNIYASEALWRARIDPRVPANRVAPARLAALVQAIRATLRDALRHHARYYGADPGDPQEARFAVYDHQGEPCRRCAGTIKRITQAARSTYFCPSCQSR